MAHNRVVSVLVAPGRRERTENFGKGAEGWREEEKASGAVLFGDQTEYLGSGRERKSDRVIRERL
jgi:hypothetical protein